jgi:ribosomal protein S26
MYENRTVKKVFPGKPERRRKPRRPKLRCLDCTENDPKSMNVKRWRKRQTTSLWAVILKEALTEL